MAKPQQKQMQLFSKSTGFMSAGRVIDPLSAGIQHDLSAGQKVTGLNVPIVSFGNPVIDDLQRDLYWAMYLARDNLLKTSPAGREVVRGMLEWVLSDPTFKTKTMMLVNHKVSAASASYVMVEQLMDMPQMKEGMDGLGEAEKNEKQADDLEKQADEQEQEGQGEPQDEPGENESDNPSQDPNEDDGDGQGGSGEGGDEQSNGSGNGWDSPDEQDAQDPTPEELRERSQELREQAAQLRAQAEQAIQAALEAKMNEFGRAGSIDAGANSGEEVAAFLSSWGVDEGKGMVMNPLQIMEIMKTIKATDVGKLTSLIGRVYGVANNTLRGRSSAKIIVDEGGITKDIQAMHPAERYKLTKAYPYRAQAIEEWLTRGLGGVTKSMQATREGNFICMVDESGSMCDYVESGEGTREDVAKALALGIAKAAIENGQQIVLAGFGSSGEITELVTNETPLDKKLEWATFMFDGGTDLSGALMAMMDIADGYDESERLNTDLVIITDGQADIAESVIDRLKIMKETYGTRLFALMIGCDPDDDMLEIADTAMVFNGLDKIAEKLSGMIWEQE